MKFDTVVIGGGQAGFEAAMDALKAGRSCALVSKGRSLDKIGYEEFTAAGGMLMLGDEVTASAPCAGRVTTLKGVSLEADVFVLATGRFFSGGLKADMDSVCETVFGLDLDFPEDRTEWFSTTFADDQPFQEFGVKVDALGHPSVNGVKQDNIIVKGNIISRRHAE